MSANKPLQGVSLIDCAKSNAAQGLEVACRQCGFDDRTEQFLEALKQACHQAGITIDGLEDLMTDQQRVTSQGGVAIAPDTPNDL